MNLILTMSLILGTCALAAVFSRASNYRRLHHFEGTSATGHAHTPQDSHSHHGQATTEYALVLLGAGLIALILITWATTGGAEGRIGQLFDSVIDTITSRI